MGAGPYRTCNSNPFGVLTSVYETNRSLSHSSISIQRNELSYGDGTIGAFVFMWNVRQYLEAEARRQWVV